VTREQTGVRQLDAMLGGGFLPGDAALVVGSTGTGKTVMGLQYLVNGATRYNENGLYVTFEQLPQQIYRDASSLGWDLRKLEEQDRLRVICTSPDLLLVSDSNRHLLDEPIRQIKPKRIVIDTLNHLEMYVEPGKMRRETYRLIMYLKNKGLNSMLLWEGREIIGSTMLTHVGISFLADCIIALRYVEIESSVRKALVVLKERGSDHDKRLTEFEITSRGIMVKAPFVGYEGIFMGTPGRTFTERAAKSWVKAFKGKK